jgi:hypothetical protein
MGPRIILLLTFLVSAGSEIIPKLSRIESSSWAEMPVYPGAFQIPITFLKCHLKDVASCT